LPGKAISIAPSLLAKLVGDDVLHKWYYVPVVYGVYCAAAMLALLFIRETRDISLEDLDVPTPQVVPSDSATTGAVLRAAGN